MRQINKKRNFISDNSGESMVEVLVAFTLLSIMLVLFTQGITWATKSEVNATRNRNAADNAMKNLQQDIADGNIATYQVSLPLLKDRIKRGVAQYTDDEGGNVYTYIYYEPIRNTGG